MRCLGQEYTQWLLLKAALAALLLCSTRHLTGKTSRCACEMHFSGSLCGLASVLLLPGLRSNASSQTRPSWHYRNLRHPPRAPRHSAVQHSNFAECKRRLQPGIAASLQLANRVMSRQCSSKTAAEGRAIQTFRTLLGTAKPKQLIMQFRSNGRLCWVLVGGRVAFGTCSWLVPACSHREDTSAPHDE